MMQRGRDALSSVLIGFVLSKSLSDWLAFAHCCVNGWPAVTWQFVDPIISVPACGCVPDHFVIIYKIPLC